MFGQARRPGSSRSSSSSRTSWRSRRSACEPAAPGSSGRRPRPSADGALKRDGAPSVASRAARARRGGVPTRGRCRRAREASRRRGADPRGRRPRAGRRHRGRARRAGRAPRSRRRARRGPPRWRTSASFQAVWESASATQSSTVSYVASLSAAHGSSASERGEEAVAQRRRALDHERRDELVLGGELAVDAAHADADRLGKHRHRDVDALAREQPVGDRERARVLLGDRETAHGGAGTGIPIAYPIARNSHSGMSNAMEQHVMPPLRSRTVTHGRNMAGARALLRAAGVAREDFGKPIVAVANSYTQFVPGHTHLKPVGEVVSDGGPRRGRHPPRVQHDRRRRRHRDGPRRHALLAALARPDQRQRRVHGQRALRRRADLHLQLRQDHARAC